MHRPTLLVGCGVVGTSIARCHLDNDVRITIADISTEKLQATQQQLIAWGSIETPPATLDALKGLGLHTATIRPRGGALRRSAEDPDSPPIVIESVAEILEIKHKLLADLQSALPTGSVFCSNTSTLRIESIAKSLADPRQFCGMHFFMPVGERDAVEVIAGTATSAATIATAVAHATRIGKTPMQVADSPGFIVNRMLSPYLNEALLMLCEGATPAQLKTAAIQYGMPISPLELIDQIGAQTMYLSGSVFLRSFPDRMDPALIIRRMIKKKRLGPENGGGFLDDGEMPADVREMVESYRPRTTNGSPPLTIGDVKLRLQIPMMIESALLWRHGIVRDRQHFDRAMAGGLGFRKAPAWTRTVAAIEDAAILRCMDKFGNRSAALRLPQGIAIRDLKNA